MMPSVEGETMKTIGLLRGAVLIAIVSATIASASDAIAVYARIDRVVVEPASGPPEAIQLWGVFSLARAGWASRSYQPGDDYLPAARGYLYFKLAGNPDAARKEWADLKQLAGTGQIVSFGSRSELRPILRKPVDRPANPDPYVVNVGLSKVRGNTDYPPVRALVDFKD
jgi:hypothetical protein